MDARAKENLEYKLQNEEISEEQKEHIIEETMKKEADRQMRVKNDKKVEAYVDRVEFGKQGYRERFYQNKFLIKNHEQLEQMQINIRKAYIEGLQWVFAYYYQGCISWSWFYPFHYAPMAADLVQCDQVEINFEMSSPLHPLE